jgi:hypothetical protein
VDAVQKPVDHGRREHAGGNDEDQARVQGVQAGEDLAIGCQVGLDGTHPAQQHSGVYERITVSETLEVLIAGNANGE